MSIIHIVAEIPEDSIVDTRLPITVSCWEHNFNSVDSEFRSVEGKLVSYSGILSQVDELRKQHIESGDVIMFKYPGDVDPEEVMQVKDILVSLFPDNTVLCLTSDDELLVSNPGEAIELLEKMIAHIKVQSSVPNQIILA